MRMKAQPRAPLALAAAAFSCGIWLSGHLQPSSALWGWATASLALCALAAVAIRSLRPAQVSALLALICAGAFARVATPSPHLTMPPPAFVNVDDVEIVGHVTNDGALLAGGGPRERFDIQTETIELDGLKIAQPMGIRATVFSRDAVDEADEDDAQQLPHLAYGTRLRLKAKLRLPRNFRNPGSFDYEGYLHGQGISALASVKAEHLEVLEGASGSRLGFWRSRVRNSILQHIHRDGLWSKEDAAIFAAMIMGDDSLLLRNIREEFQQTGVYHLLVVSGMNVALLAFAIFWLARRLRLPEWPASLLTIALSLFYAYIVGMGVPIMRAVLMLSLFLVARLLYRDRSGLNATGFAALVVLGLSPAALFDAGFQLTFLALLAITGICLPILERTSTPYRSALHHLDSTGYDLGLEPKLAQFRLDLRLIAGRVGQFAGARAAWIIVTGCAAATLALFELVLVSAVTQAVLVLPMRAYFHRAAIIGLPANVLVLPLAGVMLNTGVAAIALSYVSLPFARLTAALAAAALHWTLACLHFLSRFHVSQWRAPDPTLLLALLAVAGILLAFFAVRKQRAAAFAGLISLFLCGGIVAVYHAAPKIEHGKLEITAIDVGQGDSLLVVSPEGRTMLIDGGGSMGPVHSEFDFGEDVVAPYLWSRGLERLDVVALTHAHGDHIGGLPRIIEDFRPSELWVGINPETPALLHLYEVAQKSHVAIRRHTAGDDVDWGETKIRVLSPPADWQPKSKRKNDDSLAILIGYGDTRALLAGDLEKKMERFVATESPQADLLKVAHHGSATSTTPELLAAVHPRFAVISAGYQNSFKHPRQVVLDRLQAAHVQTYRTDLQGAVTFLLDGKHVEARVQPQ
ncbi:MAG: internalization-related competence protein ComEC/Rec2 [Candidatus Angelobacter sp.]|nr:internalization-related competence protein ComEC/Rec2 [Candidatus Angelobacter sp.]